MISLTPARYNVIIVQISLVNYFPERHSGDVEVDVEGSCMLDGCGNIILELTPLF